MQEKNLHLSFAHARLQNCFSLSVTVAAMSRPIPPFPAAVPAYGLGLRQPHYEQVLAEKPAVDWFEVLTENVMGGHDGHREYLVDLRADYALALHGVGLSIGSTDALDTSYLRGLKSLADAIAPAFVSDHLCFTGVRGLNSHDLLPVPYTDIALQHIADRVEQVQQFLGRQLVLENPSTYGEYQASTLSEGEFLNRLAARTGCGLLLDINNIYVSARNHGSDPLQYLREIDPAAIAYVHLAGHRDFGTHIVDTHDAPVADAVWQLYRAAVRQFGPLHTLLEWDGNIPPLAMLCAELDKARVASADSVRKAAS